MKLEIVTPEKKMYEGDVDEVRVNTSEGEIGILPHHVNLFSRVEPGELKIKKDGKDEYMAITGGFLEVSNNTVTLLADYAVHADAIEVDKAMEAKKRAEELLKRKETQMDEREYAEVQSAFKQAILELHVAGRRKRRNI
jgi:F-type H+-transporting ATPase subunit epsilon